MSILEERVKYASEFLKKLDLTGAECGKYPVNDWFFYNVQEYTTRNDSDVKAEAHRNYVDIQYMVSGAEFIGVCDTASAELITPYSEENDVSFSMPAGNEMKIFLTEGSYVVLYPENAHRPGISAGEPAKVKKAVGKVRIP